MYVSRKTRDWLGRVLVWVIVGAAAFAAFGVMQDCLCAPSAEAEEGESYEVIAAILALQPATTPERAARLAGIFAGAGHETRIDPLLLVAIAMRESSLREDVEQLKRLGRRGERGLLQLMPRGVALSHRPEACGPELEGAHCQVYAGAMWLAHLRDEQCPGSTWRWVAAFGWSRCPNEHEARADRNANIAASYYAQVGGTRW
ncbi:MAG: hypothetical protein M0R22_00495 [Dehalococcoidia bacterium]|jgi:hypothetical protein|nr:hypothetical protein [Dehalococcoidia bacterium]